MSDARRHHIAKELCAIANPGVDPSTRVYFGVPQMVSLPAYPHGFAIPTHEPQPMWTYFLHAADRVIGAMEDADD